MNLLDMPPEIFYKITEEYVTSTSYHSDLKNLRLVNSNFALNSLSIMNTQANKCREF